MDSVRIQWFDRETLDRVITEYVQRVDVVLDIGCGVRPQAFFQPRLHICCEPYSEYVRILQNHFAEVPNVVILRGTAQEIVGVMPDKSVDSVFLIDLIEHLERDEGHQLLRECRRIARRQIVLFTPLGFMPQEYQADDVDGWGLRGGEWQAHKSGWTPDDFDPSWNILASEAYHTVSGTGEVLDPPFGAFWAIHNIQQKESLPFPAKLGVLSHTLPPSPSIQAMVLYRLFQNVRPEDYCLLSRENYDAYAYLQSRTCLPDSLPRLLTHYYHLPPEFQSRRPSSPEVRSARQLLNILPQVFQRGLLQVFRRAKSVVRVVRHERCDAILACSGNPYDLPAGYLASRWAGVPFYAYVFDYYSYQWTRLLHRYFARYVEPIVLKGAAGVIVPNEFLRDEYRRRYEIEPIVIHNPCEVSETDHKVPWPASHGEIRIMCTGAAYRTHYDAFRNLIAAVQQLDRPDVELHVYTAQPQAESELENIGWPLVRYNRLAPSHVLEVQRSADILFLPLAFNSPTPEVIRTSAPGKMGEYLASGRPVLVHAPADSFVSWYFKEHECGVVVDQSEPGMLAQAIGRILNDADLRQRVGENARARARADFNLAVAQAKFVKLFQPKGRG